MEWVSVRIVPIQNDRCNASFAKEQEQTEVFVAGRSGGSAFAAQRERQPRISNFRLAHFAGRSMKRGEEALAGES
jgi:hypothetical protein